MIIAEQLVDVERRVEQPGDLDEPVERADLVLEPAPELRDLTVLVVHAAASAIVLSSLAGAAAGSASRAAMKCSTKSVETSPERNCASARISWWKGIVVFTPRPEIWNSESARCMRSIARSRSGAQTISFAISES